MGNWFVVQSVLALTKKMTSSLEDHRYCYVTSIQPVTDILSGLQA